MASRTYSLENPDFVIFDLDPMENTDFEDARKVALALKKMLDNEELVGFRRLLGQQAYKYMCRLPQNIPMNRQENLQNCFALLLKDLYRYNHYREKCI